MPKATWTSGSDWRVTMEDGGVSVFGVAIGACAVSDMSEVVGIADMRLVV